MSPPFAPLEAIESREAHRSASASYFVRQRLPLIARGHCSPPSRRRMLCWEVRTCSATPGACAVPTCARVRRCGGLTASNDSCGFSLTAQAHFSLHFIDVFDVFPSNRAHLLRCISLSAPSGTCHMCARTMRTMTARVRVDAVAHTIRMRAFYVFLFSRLCRACKSTPATHHHRQSFPPPQGTCRIVTAASSRRSSALRIVPHSFPPIRTAKSTLGTNTQGEQHRDCAHEWMHRVWEDVFVRSMRLKSGARSLWLTFASNLRSLAQCRRNEQQGI